LPWFANISRVITIFTLAEYFPAAISLPFIKYDQTPKGGLPPLLLLSFKVLYSFYLYFKNFIFFKNNVKEKL